MSQAEIFKSHIIDVVQGPSPANAPETEGNTHHHRPRPTSITQRIEAPARPPVEAIAPRAVEARRSRFPFPVPSFRRSSIRGW